MVDGYSSEVSQFTVQNQVKTYNHRLLNHVKLVEPPPPFPVGRKTTPTSLLELTTPTSMIQLLVNWSSFAGNSIRAKLMQRSANSRQLLYRQN